MHGETVAHLGPGDILGVIAVFAPGPRVVSATTVEKTRLLWISKQAFEEAMVEHPEIAQASLRALARRLRKGADQMDHWIQSPRTDADQSV
jgi:CRP-like cAMP-binding protein